MWEAIRATEADLQNMAKVKFETQPFSLLCDIS